MKFVIKVGGSLVFPEGGADHNYLKRLIPVLSEINENHQLIIAIGGGKYLRNYMKNMHEDSEISISNMEREEIYIQLLHANVLLFSKLLKMKPIRKIEEVGAETSGIIGGIVPGRNTDANAAICAAKIKADLFIKITNVDGIYDKDPNKFNDARMMNIIMFSDLKSNEKVAPVDYGVLDPISVETIKENKIKTVLMNGSEPENLLKIIEGEKIGTLIC
ncbi:MAG: hypothetical protein HY513_01260 [Candidatus Aenigmarchaeota archaeon]|nr:hypothetical protein [Candidatus Aenigmarchaeota archaeon]